LFFAKIDHAATVFDITASHKPPSWPTWNHGSALIIKGPAHSALSHANAQPRCLSGQQVSAHLSNVRKNELNMTWFWKAWTQNVQKRFGEPFLMARRTAKPFGYNSFSDDIFLVEKRVFAFETRIKFKTEFELLR